MIQRKWLASAAVLGIFIGGCNKKDDTTSNPPATPPVTPTAPQSNNLPTTDSLKNAVTNGVDSAKTQLDATAANISPDAASKLTQVEQYIKDNKLDLADKALKEVEANKATLPAALQQQVAALRTQLDLAKSNPAGGMTMPSMPK